MTAGTTGMLAADFLDQPAPYAAFAEAGYSAVMLYLRVLTAEMVTEAHAAGLAVIPIYETQAEEAMGGAPQGATDGEFTKTALQNLGAPAGSAVGVNITDFQPNADQIEVVYQYFQAFESALAGEYVMLPYVTNYALEQMQALGAPAQTMWWENQMTDEGVAGDAGVNPATALYQRLKPSRSVNGLAPGDGWDEDVVCNDFSIPWWSAAVTPPPPPPPPAPPPPNPQPSPQEVDVQVPELSIINPGPGVVDRDTLTVQTLLTYKWGFTVGGCDGRYGPDTETAVKNFQSRHALAADGVVGPVTWGWLVNQ